MLGPLFRQLAQNERSLFAFLASTEPFGFQEFLGTDDGQGRPVRLDHLYDYVVASLGPRLFAQHRGKLWAEVQSALDRLHDATETEIRLGKSIGLLQALGPAAGVTASAETLHAALKGTASEKETEKAIQSLLTAVSGGVSPAHRQLRPVGRQRRGYRRPALSRARQSVERDQNIAAFLMREMPPQQLIARRHYFQTGTLRYFDASYADRDGLQADLFTAVCPADASGTPTEARALPSARTPTTGRPCAGRSARSTTALIVAAAAGRVRPARALPRAGCLRWVSQHTPELESDRTARRELHARLSHRRAESCTHLEWVFSPANAAVLSGIVAAKRVTVVPAETQRSDCRRSANRFTRLPRLGVTN